MLQEANLLQGVHLLPRQVALGGHGGQGRLRTAGVPCLHCSTVQDSLALHPDCFACTTRQGHNKTRHMSHPRNI